MNIAKTETAQLNYSYNEKDGDNTIYNALAVEAKESKAAEKAVMLEIVKGLTLPREEWKESTDQDGNVLIIAGHDAGSDAAKAVAEKVTKFILVAVDELRKTLGDTPSKADAKRVTNLQAKYLQMVAQATGFKPARIPNTKTFTLVKVEAKGQKKLGADGNAPQSTGLEPVENRDDKTAKTLASLSPEDVLSSLAKTYASRQAFLADCLKAANAQFPGEVPEPAKKAKKKAPTNTAMADAMAKAGAA